MNRKLEDLIMAIGDAGTIDRCNKLSIGTLRSLILSKPLSSEYIVYLNKGNLFTLQTDINAITWDGFGIFKESKNEVCPLSYIPDLTFSIGDITFHFITKDISCIIFLPYYNNVKVKNCVILEIEV